MQQDNTSKEAPNNPLNSAMADPEAPVMMPPVASTPTENSAPMVSVSAPKSKISNPVLAIIVLVVGIALGIGVYFVFIKKAVTPTAANSTPIPVAVVATPNPNATPVSTPITTNNVDQTLNGSDAAVQQTVNQANTDLNTVNSVNSTQDTNSGL